MAVNITYINSEDISVFPAGFRGSEYDLNAKLTSEQNLTNIIRINKNKQFNNFVLRYKRNEGGNEIILSISGYRFIIAENKLGNYKYAGIKTQNITDTTNVEGSGAGSIGNMLINIDPPETGADNNLKLLRAAGDYNLDIKNEVTHSFEFRGLILFNDVSDIDGLGLTDYIQIRDDKGNLIERGFRLGTDSVINNSAANDVTSEISIDTEFTTNKLNVNDEAIIKKLNVNNQATIKSGETNYNEFTLDGEGIKLETASSKKVNINNITFEAKTAGDEISFTKNTSIKYNTSKSITFNNNGLTVNDNATVNEDVKIKSDKSIQIGDGNKITKDLFIGKFGSSSTDEKMRLETTNSDGYYFDASGNLRHRGTTNTDAFNIKKNNGDNVFSVIYETGEVNTKSVHADTFYAGSDRRIKENIKDTEIAGLDIINNISVKEYNLIVDEEKKNTIGCIAQELREVLPDNLQSIVKGVEEKETLAIDNDKLIYILIKAVQELSKEIEELKK